MKPFPAIMVFLVTKDASYDYALSTVPLADLYWYKYTVLM